MIDPMTRLLRLALPWAAAALATLAIGADAAPARTRAAPAKAQGTNWSSMVVINDGGHLLGNPEAANKLVEYMSYTCSHCADFARTGDMAIRLLLVPKGTVSYEIRHLLRDPVDLTAALLTHCGDVEKFPANHSAIISKQAEWMETARKATQAQRTRWTFGTNAARWRAIASDLGFYDIMEARGYSRPALDHCLADDAKAKLMAETSQRDVEALGLKGTPSFVLNGKLLDGIYNWDTLKPVLEKLD